MTTLRENAVAEYQAQEDEEQAQEEEARAALMAAARAAVRPVLTDRNGTLAVDPATMTVRYRSLEDGLVVLQVGDGSDLTLAVYPHADPARVHLVQEDGGEWANVRQVTTLAQIGQAVVQGEV